MPLKMVPRRSKLYIKVKNPGSEAPLEDLAHPRGVMLAARGSIGR
jgi:hypothetical protein